MRYMNVQKRGMAEGDDIPTEQKDELEEQLCNVHCGFLNIDGGRYHV
jgi:hypothetical protein